MSQELKVERVLSPIQVLDRHLRPTGVYSSEAVLPYSFSRPIEGAGSPDLQYYLALVDGCLCYVELARD